MVIVSVHKDAHGFVSQTVRFQERQNSVLNMFFPSKGNLRTETKEGERSEESPLSFRMDPGGGPIQAGPPLGGEMRPWRGLSEVRCGRSRTWGFGFWF